jgi:hypothetical protein
MLGVREPRELVLFGLILCFRYFPINYGSALHNNIVSFALSKAPCERGVVRRQFFNSRYYVRTWLIVLPVV